MEHKYNKGEWSEFYAFIKILGDRELAASDEKLNAIPNLTYPVTKLIQKDLQTTREYNLSSKENLVITTMDSEGRNVTTANYEDIKSKTKTIFTDLKQATGRSFVLVSADSLIGELNFGKIKAGASKKGDIVIVLHDHITSQDHEVEFSIKSYLGGQPTLLNPSKIGTNFKFKVVGFSGDVESINSIDSNRKVLDRFEAIRTAGGELEFAGMLSSTFQKNIRKIDSFMPEIVGEYLRLANKGRGKKISDLTKLVFNSPPIAALLEPSLDHEDIKYKIKQLLLNVALGMVPQTEWDGLFKADGGYIVVREDGEVVCFHVYNISQLSEYLFQNTTLETPSTSRYNFASLYQESNSLYINLNLQIRFIKPLKTSD